MRGRWWILLTAAWLVGGCVASTHETQSPGVSAPRAPVPGASVAGTTMSTLEAIDVIAFGSCARQDLPQPIWDQVLTVEPDLFLMLGDNIYADDHDAERLAGAYAELAAHEGFARLRREVPILATWDDHDYGRGDGGAEHPDKRMYEQTFLDFFDVPADDVRRSRPGLYTARTFGPPGQRVQVILLDTRYFRGPLVRNPAGESAERGRYVPNDDASVTLLGDAQWRWLDTVLREPAEVRLIGSSIQAVANGHGWEKWGNLPHERARLFRVIRESGAEGVIFLSGDRHTAELSRLPTDDPNGVGYPLYDFTASGLTHAATTLPPERNLHRVVTERSIKVINFGTVRIDWSASSPEVVLEAVGLDGESLLREAIPLATLRRSAAP